MRLGFHDTFTRLVFDAEGPRPSSIGPPSEKGIAIQFSKLQTTMENERTIEDNSSRIRKVSFQKKKGQILVTFQEPHVTVQTGFLDAGPYKEGHYRLVLDFFTQKTPEKRVKTSAPTPDTKEGTKKISGKKPGDADKVSVSLETSQAAKTLDEVSMQFGNEKRDSTDEILQQADRCLLEKDNAKAFALYEELLKTASLGKERQTALYGLAESFFLMHQNDLVNHGPEALKRYNSALQEGSIPSRTPLALYRVGLCYLALKNVEKAKGYFKQVTQEYPEDPAAAASWLRLSEIYRGKKNYVEAIETAKALLKRSTSQPEKAEAYYYIGQNFALVGEHQQAVEAFQECLKLDQQFYLRKPDILKYMGQALSCLKYEDNSREFLLHYMNLTSNTDDRDLLLAKIMETLLSQHEERLANRLYSYLQVYYPDSEGASIGSIRRAEYLEAGDKRAQDEAIYLYRELSRKSLSPPLDGLVQFKLALWEWKNGNLEKSLSLIEDRPQGSLTDALHNEFVALREKVILDMLRQAFEQKKYDKVLGLYQGNIPMFQTLKDFDVFTIIGRSYEELQSYPEAMVCYNTVLENTGKENGKCLLNMAQCSFRMGKLEKALQFCRRIPAGDNEGQKNELMAKIFFAQGKYSETLQQLGHIFPKERKLTPDDFEWVNMYIECSIETGKYSDALSWIQKGLELLKDEDSGKRAQLCLLKSRCHKNLKQPAEAIKCLESALSLLQEEDLKGQLNYEISNLYLQIGDKQQAVQKLSQVLKSGSSFWQTAAQQQLDYIQLKEEGLKIF
ncbi:hypothetical protein DAMNIGENAA_10280 [Desulforhabdus amnigena]|jgi:tetratricopeptide (TPR) repeat protein|uniref:Tetratricopeptide repeat protein n=2 Tax=Desulforhabdus amnigena TaxID=40218 RepID=A0A9W6D3P2_9BACT|nr:hypothetical protein DAMNIGENAA_10280 [Desulforhabdus amnigena]